MKIRAQGETDAAVERIEELLSHARPVPLTNQVRLELNEARRLVDELRQALAAERRGS